MEYIILSVIFIISVMAAIFVAQGLYNVFSCLFQWIIQKQRESYYKRYARKNKDTRPRVRSTVYPNDNNVA